MRLRYNAPITLTFALICALVLGIIQLFGLQSIQALFVAPAKGTFNSKSFVDYIRLVTHVIGHADWNHLMSNFAFILLLGPILEEKYGSTRVLIMVLITALVTGAINVLFLPSGLLGASGIVFMMILLVSFTNFRQGEIPLTFILVVILYLAREILNAFQVNNIAEFAHIAGGIIGSLFGFFLPPKRKAQVQQA